MTNPLDTHPSGHATPRIRDLARQGEHDPSGKATWKKVASADGSCHGRVYHLDDGDYLCVRKTTIGTGATGRCYAGLGPAGQPMCFKEVNPHKLRERGKILELDTIDRGFVRDGIYFDVACLAAIDSPVVPRYLLDRGEKLAVIMPLCRNDLDRAVGGRSAFDVPHLSLADLADSPPSADVEARRLAASRAVHAILLSVGQALVHAHDRGLRHNDINGKNLLVPPEGEGALLVDFNAAQRLRGHDLGAAVVGHAFPYLKPPEADLRFEGKRNLTLAQWLTGDIYMLAAAIVSQTEPASIASHPRADEEDLRAYRIRSKQARIYTERLGKGLPVPPPADNEQQSICRLWRCLHQLSAPLPRLLAEMLSFQPADRPTARQLVETLRAHPLPPAPPGQGRWDPIGYARTTSWCLDRARELRTELIASGAMRDGPVQRTLRPGQRALDVPALLPAGEAEMTSGQVAGQDIADVEAAARREALQILAASLVTGTKAIAAGVALGALFFCASSSAESPWSERSWPQ